MSGQPVAFAVTPRAWRWADSQLRAEAVREARRELPGATVVPASDGLVVFGVLPSTVPNPAQRAIRLREVLSAAIECLLCQSVYDRGIVR